MFEPSNKDDLTQDLLDPSSSSNNKSLNIDPASLPETNSSNSLALTNYEDDLVKEVLASVAEANTDPLAVTNQTEQGTTSNDDLTGQSDSEALASPDLTISSISTPTTGQAGTTLSFNYGVKNSGGASAESSYTHFYLSKDKTFDNSDIYLGYDYVSSLSAGSSRSESVSKSLSSSLAAGDYYLIAKADGWNWVKESNETNNITLISATIKIGNSGGGKGYSSISGYGSVNAAAAVAKALGKSSPFPDVANVNDKKWGVDAVKAPEVWKQGYTGKGITVAVLDTGVYRNHSDLNANIWKNTKEIAGNGQDDDGNGYVDDVYGWNTVNNNNNTLDKHGHGTHVSGTIAGEKNNFGVTGIAYDAKIMAVKVLSDTGSGSWMSVANGIRYAVDNGADVINMSLGGGSGNSTLQAAIKYASDKGVIVVSAAGNSAGSAPGYPARYATSWGLAVGAVDKNNNMASFSNRAGSNSNMAYVTAPGVGIYSTLPGNRYASWNGTSMATPHVAGIVALMLSAKAGLTDAQVRSIITSTAQNSVKANGGSFVGSSGVSGASISSSSDLITESVGTSSANSGLVIDVTPIGQDNQDNGGSSTNDDSSEVASVFPNNSNTTDDGSSGVVSLFPSNSGTQTTQQNGQGTSQNSGTSTTDNSSTGYGSGSRYYYGSGLEYDPLTGMSLGNSLVPLRVSQKAFMQKDGLVRL